jgi:putative sterol carrier protein
MIHITVSEFFQVLPDKFDAQAASSMNVVYQFNLSGPQGGQYYLAVKDQACSVQTGVHPAPQVTLSMTGEDCIGILTGRLDGPSTFLSGRLQIAGDLGLAIQLKTLFPSIR